MHKDLVNNNIMNICISNVSIFLFQIKVYILLTSKPLFKIFVRYEVSKKKVLCTQTIFKQKCFIFKTFISFWLLLPKLKNFYYIIIKEISLNLTYFVYFSTEILISKN